MIGDRWGVTGDEVARHYPCTTNHRPHPLDALVNDLTGMRPLGDERTFRSRTLGEIASAMPLRSLAGDRHEFAHA